MVLGGAVHDFVILAGSVRRDGKSLAEIVRQEIGPTSGVIAGFAVLFIVTIAIAEILRYTVTPLQQWLFGRSIVDPEVIRMLLFGLAMVVIMLYRPSGLWPAPRHGDKPARAANSAGGGA